MREGEFGSVLIGLRVNLSTDPALALPNLGDAVGEGSFGPELLKDFEGHDELTRCLRMNGICEQGEVRGLSPTSNGVSVERAPQVDKGKVPAPRFLEAIPTKVGEQRIVAGRDFLALKTPGLVVGASLGRGMIKHGRREQDRLGAHSLDAVEQFVQSVLECLEGFGRVIFILTIVHPEKDGDVVWFVAGHIVIESSQGIRHLVPGHTGIVEGEFPVRVASEEEVLEVLGVEALVSDRVPEKDDSLTGLGIEGQRVIGEGGSQPQGQPEDEGKGSIHA